MSPDAVCPVCGFSNPSEPNFCSACGSPFPKDVEQETSRIPVVGVDVPGQGEVGQLIISRGPTAGARFAISDSIVRIGRDPKSQVFLDDITVSRRHAEIHREDDNTYTVSDSESLNGTYLDGERITHAVLREGAQLQVGRFRLVFVIGTLGGSA